MSFRRGTRRNLFKDARSQCMFEKISPYALRLAPRANRLFVEMTYL